MGAITLKLLHDPMSFSFQTYGIFKMESLLSFLLGTDLDEK